MKYLFIVVLLVFAGCKNEVKKENIKVVENSRVDYLPYYNDESFTPHWLTPNTEEEKTFHKIPDFSLTNQSGETVTQDTFEDKIYVTDFFFTTCPPVFVLK
ncbi:SenC protein [Algibacter lectus]|uniref:SenC protein n=1 Tax=Algibacter lectus TaxID=221126 RepID=A0A090WMM5_9FLAO|nr:SCO family protein [Algibacter lectus]GAL78251.1 SenC protein [Algibacter lectus]